MEFCQNPAELASRRVRRRESEASTGHWLDLLENSQLKEATKIGPIVGNCCGSWQFGGTILPFDLD